jgi:ubiquinone/menaquinone biosynthesis C-methylase UbiE
MDRVRDDALMARPPVRPWGFGGWRWELLGGVRGRTLEIGCGWGHNFAHYPVEARVTAFDLEPERVRSARERRAPIPLAIADAHHLAWPAQTFDSIVGTLVFCSIPEPAQALAEARRVLKPSGRLFLVEHVRSHQHWLGALQDVLAPAWLWMTDGCHLNRNTEGLVRAAGYDLERVKIGFGGLLKLMIARPR